MLVLIPRSASLFAELSVAFADTSLVEEWWDVSESAGPKSRSRSVSQEVPMPALTVLSYKNDALERRVRTAYRFRVSFAGLQSCPLLRSCTKCSKVAGCCARCGGRLRTSSEAQSARVQWPLRASPATITCKRCLRKRPADTVTSSKPVKGCQDRVQARVRGPLRPAKHGPRIHTE